ncbi:MAG: alpha-L-fucosidase [Verrucomicrobiae bacterium]|nr:alpha-L-fucosidase [Verrucomicrobiae bacterium]
MNNKRVDWFYHAKWGIFVHCLSASPSLETGKLTSVEGWNKKVDAFDAEGLAEQLQAAGASYMFITIGQNSGFYCAPNESYDKITGINPSKCSRRDLVGDLHDALGPRGIKLMVYVPSNAPCFDKIALERFEWKWGYKGVDWPQHSDERTGLRLAEFQLKWESVLREWSVRWGNKVGGWWVDGCYFKDEMYNHAKSPNFGSFAAALRAGNQESLVSFSDGGGLPVRRVWGEEDYTHGELWKEFPVCPGRWLDGAQYHILSYLGDDWGTGEPRFTDEFVMGYTQDVNAKGGVVTWDVPAENGLIPQSIFKQLKKINGK